MGKFEVNINTQFLPGFAPCGLSVFTFTDFEEAKGFSEWLMNGHFGGYSTPWEVSETIQTPYRPLGTTFTQVIILAPVSSHPQPRFEVTGGLGGSWAIYDNEADDFIPGEISVHGEWKKELLQELCDFLNGLVQGSDHD